MIGLDFIPKDDQSEFEIAITTPPGWTLDRTSDVFARDRGARSRALAGGRATSSTTIGDTTGKVSKGQGDVTAGDDLRPPGRPRGAPRKAPTGLRSASSTCMGRAQEACSPTTRTCAELRVERRSCPATSRAAPPTPTSSSTSSAPTSRKLTEYCRPDHREAAAATPGLADVDTTPLAAQARAARRRRPRAGQRPGHPIADHRLDAAHAGRRRARLRLQGQPARRAVRRLAARRGRRPRRPRRRRAA